MFGDRLRRARTAKGYTLDTLAQSYNARFGGALSKGTLSKYENGKQEPMAGVVVGLAQLLGVSADYLLGLPDAPGPAETPGAPDEESGPGPDDYRTQLFAAYGEVKQELDQDDIDDLKLFMQMIAQRKRQKRGEE